MSKRSLHSRRVRSVFNSLLGALLLTQTSALSQPFGEARSGGGWPFHDIVLDGASYRITRAESSISRIDGKTEEVQLTEALPIPLSTALIRGFRRNDDLLLFYGRRSFVEGEEVEGMHTNGGVLVSLNPQTLKTNWHQEMPKYSENLYVEGGALYASFDDTIEKFDLKTGKKLWSQSGLHGPGWLRPRIDGQKITYPSRGEALNTPMDIVSPGFVTLETSTGAVLERQWNVLKPSLFQSLTWAAKSAESEILAFHALPRGDRTCLEFNRVGRVILWEAGQGAPLAKGLLPLAPGEKMVTSYAGAISNRVYVLYQTDHRLAHLVCIDRESLELQWHHKVDGVFFAPPGNLGGASAVIVVDNKVQNIDLKTGKLLWESKNLPVNLDGSADIMTPGTPALSGDRVILEEASGTQLRPDKEVGVVVEPGQIVLDRKTGNVLERKPTKVARGIAR